MLSVNSTSLYFDFILKDKTSWHSDMSGPTTEESALFPNGPRKVGTVKYKHDLVRFNSVFTHTHSVATRITCNLQTSKRKVINEKPEYN